MRELGLCNRQRDRRLRLRTLRSVVRTLLEEQLKLEEYALGVRLVSERTMARVNQTYLGHEGPTDVISFDHRGTEKGPLWGELYICVAVAVVQGREFGVGWEEELARYVVHGVLHLLGYDDLTPIARRKMKREEERQLALLSRRFCWSDLGEKEKSDPEPAAKGKSAAKGSGGMRRAH